MLILKDQLGREHRFEQSPKRIVSLVPSLTETLFDLGLEDELVGITTACMHPYQLRVTKTSIGEPKKVDIEQIQLMQPDVVVASPTENTMEDIERLQAICPVWLVDVRTMDQNFQLIELLGQLFNKRTEARKWMDKISFGQKDLMDFVSERPGFKVAYFIGKDPFVVAGEGTFIQELLELNKFENVYADRVELYPEVEIKKIRIQGDPELVFLPSMPYAFQEEDAFEIGRFTHHGKTIFVEGEMFSWYGTRVCKAFDYFKQIHNRL
ncbi:ABC transporter substrate-binding protein [Myroides sp. 1354]|uniref:ABC transporter substrate-binding protein n=1 Tax=unclassified Myroides TaxID=2642485 RepID=UPI002576AAEB|nr:MULTISPECIES: helical backbone metal receptor [unclassified Myroides]MDM1046415.1 ABC transporter substrate-binding protein [Myroides sp. R163-1]MDM1057352.1 ABC transporter substrate-binding protein [Myroides sp. 1354]MDM1070635.1 ABC transporter substrate-binding protein [Myroides sp. 1372]